MQNLTLINSKEIRPFDRYKLKKEILKNLISLEQS